MKESNYISFIARKRVFRFRKKSILISFQTSSLPSDIGHWTALPNGGSSSAGRLLAGEQWWVQHCGWWCHAVHDVTAAHTVCVITASQCKRTQHWHRLHCPVLPLWILWQSEQCLQCLTHVVKSDSKISNILPVWIGPAWVNTLQFQQSKSMAAL